MPHKRPRCQGMPENIRQSIVLLDAMVRQHQPNDYRTAAKARFPGTQTWSQGPIEALRILKQAAYYLPLLRTLEQDLEALLSSLGTCVATLLSGQDADEVAMRLQALRAECTAKLSLRQKQKLALDFSQGGMSQCVGMAQSLTHFKMQVSVTLEPQTSW
jgi:hypothetical protein